jgi:phage shock protein PspC (stress-responsive transcriptional regulator)
MTPSKKRTANVPPDLPATKGSTFFRWMRSLGIHREAGWVGGVAAGIATRLGIDPSIVRGIFVVVALMGGPAALIYAAAWLLLPDVNDKIHLDVLLKGTVESPIGGIGGMVLLAMVPTAQGFWFVNTQFWGEPDWLPVIGRVLWTIIVVALVVALVVWVARRAQLPTPPPSSKGEPEAGLAPWRAHQAATRAETDVFRRRDARERAEIWHEEHERAAAEAVRQRALRVEERRRTRAHPLYSFLLIGTALVASGIATLAAQGGELTRPAVLAGLAVAVGVLGVGVIFNGLAGKRAGGAAVLATLLIFPLIYFATPLSTHAQPFAIAPITPKDSESDQTDHYYVGAGDVVLDLRNYYPRPGPDEANSARDDVELKVGLGNVKVYLPPDDFGTLDVETNSGTITKVGKGIYDDPLRNEPVESIFAIAYGPLVAGAMTQSQRVLKVRIYVGAGNVTVIQPPNTTDFLRSTNG